MSKAITVSAAVLVMIIGSEVLTWGALCVGAVYGGIKFLEAVERER